MGEGARQRREVGGRPPGVGKENGVARVRGAVGEIRGVKKKVELLDGFLRRALCLVLLLVIIRPALPVIIAICHTVHLIRIQCPGTGHGTGINEWVRVRCEYQVPPG